MDPWICSVDPPGTINVSGLGLLNLYFGIIILDFLTLSVTWASNESCTKNRQNIAPATCCTSAVLLRCHSSTVFVSLYAPANTMKGLHLMLSGLAVKDTK